MQIRMPTDKNRLTGSEKNDHIGLKYALECTIRIVLGPGAEFLRFSTNRGD